MTITSPATAEAAPSIATSADIEQACRTLSTLPPGYIPKKLFIEKARLTVTATVELVSLRREPNDGVSVFMTQREAEDEHWSNLWHSPGSVLLTGDKKQGRFGQYTTVIERIIHKELGEGIEFLADPVFMRDWFHDTKRGDEVSMLHYVPVIGGSAAGQFFPVDALPADSVDHQREFIAEAGELFRQTFQQ